MAIKWNDEMLEELKITNNLVEFTKKYNMSYNSARNKRAILLGLETEKKVEKSEKIEIEAISVPNLAEQLEEVNASTISIVPSVILNIDSLIEKGVKFYLVDVQKEISTLDKAISDVVHIVENQYDELDDANMIELTKNLGKLRRKRRLFKNEHEFLDNHRVECEAFTKFVKEIKNYSQRICDKKYTTRVLKEELGAVHIVNENNSELVALRERIAELESIKPTNNEAVEDEFLNLVKYKLKMKRKEDREKKNVVAIDLLYPQWRDMFNGMDEQTKKGILFDAYSTYDKCASENVIGSKKVRDYVVWNGVLPRLLFDKGYFIIKR